MGSNAPGKSPAGTSKWPADIVQILGRYLPGSIIDMVCQQAARRCRIQVSTGVNGAERDRLVKELCRKITLFLDPGRVRKCRAELEGLISGTEAAPRLSEMEHAVESEMDVVKGRLQTISFVREWGGSNLACTRAATVVSELARNIILYAGGGKVKLRIVDNDLEIVASDNGPGIPHIDEVLSGDYHSNTGLGQGLRGVKKLADRFDVRTGAGQGTTVTLKLKLK